MATMTATRKPNKTVFKTVRAKPIPRASATGRGSAGENYAFMDSPIFKQRGLEAQLFNFEDGEPALPLTSWYQPTREEIADQLKGTPQLMKGAGREADVPPLQLRQAQADQAAGEGQARRPDKELAEELVEWHRRFEHFREYLVRTNLALVLAMAKRTRLGDVDFAEIVSEGNMALMRAVDKFNVDKGFKFSTYACRAILKAFSRTAMKSSRYKTRFPVEFEPEMEKSDWNDRKRDIVEEDCIDELKQIVDRNLADLSDIEQTVIRRRFNWQQAGRRPADAGRGRPDHRRDQGARPPDPEQGAAQDQERHGGRRAADEALSGG